jgi:hypothetical protein
MNCNKNKNVIGNKYGRLTAIKEMPKIKLPSGQTNRIILCKCDCGAEKTIRYLHLVRFRTLSCGCLKKPKSENVQGKLGKVWRQMKARCKEDYFESHLYYKKGISVCDEWYNDFYKFRKWCNENGYKEGLVIDRIDNSKGYYPENWVIIYVCDHVILGTKCNN